MERRAILRRCISVLRILIGAGFLALGGMKLADPDFLVGGVFRALEEAGEPFAFYQRVLNKFLFRQELLAYTVAISEVLLGLSYVTGTGVSLASLGGAFLMLNIALAVSGASVANLVAHVLFAVVLLAMGRVGAGLHWGGDGWLVERINERIVLFPLRWNLPDW